MNTKKLHLWYKSKFSLWQKGFLLVAITALVFALAGIGGYNPVFASAASATLLLILHVGIMNYGLIPVLIVWLINLTVLPILAFSFLSSAPIEDMTITIVVATISLLLSSVLWTFLAYKYSSGKLWVTLAVIFLIQTALTFVGSIVLGWWQWAALIALISGAIGYFVRYYSVKGYKRNKISRRNGTKSEFTYQTLPDMPEHRRMEAVKAISGTKGFTVVHPGNGVTPALVMSKRGLFSIFFYGTDGQRIDLTGKRAPAYKKNPLSPFFASLLKRSSHVLEGKANTYTLLAIDDNAIKQNGFKVDVMSLENRVEGSIIISHVSTLTRTINQLPVMPLTETEVSKVIAYGKRVK